MIRLPTTVWFVTKTTLAWRLRAIHGYIAPRITVHPFYRPDVRRQCLTSAPGMGVPLWAAGENRTKHSTSLGAAVGEMVEALG